MAFSAEKAVGMDLGGCIFVHLNGLGTYGVGGGGLDGKKEKEIRSVRSQERKKASGPVVGSSTFTPGIL